MSLRSYSDALDHLNAVQSIEAAKDAWLAAGKPSKQYVITETVENLRRMGYSVCLVQLRLAVLSVSYAFVYSKKISIHSMSYMLRERKARAQPARLRIPFFVTSSPIGKLVCEMHTKWAFFFLNYTYTVRPLYVPTSHFRSRTYTYKRNSHIRGRLCEILL